MRQAYDCFDGCMEGNCSCVESCLASFSIQITSKLKHGAGENGKLE